MDELSSYAQIFDRHNPNWTADHAHRNIFLTVQQQYANTQFHTNGYLFLSDVYKTLGFKETQASRVVGWIKGHPDGDEDVRFNVVELPNGETWVDFNVSGYILDKFENV